LIPAAPADTLSGKRETAMMGTGWRRLLQGATAAIAALSAPGLAAAEQQRVPRFMPQADLVIVDPHYCMTM
jgi:hypothetical protein